MYNKFNNIMPYLPVVLLVLKNWAILCVKAFFMQLDMPSPIYAVPSLVRAGRYIIQFSARQ